MSAVDALKEALAVGNDKNRAKNGTKIARVANSGMKDVAKKHRKTAILKSMLLRSAPAETERLKGKGERFVIRRFSDICHCDFLRRNVRIAWHFCSVEAYISFSKTVVYANQR